MATNEQDGRPDWERRKDDFEYWYNRGMDDIITEYVRNKVRGLSWDRSDYIYALMRIEMYCVRGARHMAEGMEVHFLREDYPVEYRAIKSELDPSWPKKEAELQAKKEEEQKALLERRKEEARKEKEMRTRDKDAWKKLGGKMS